MYDDGTVRFWQAATGSARGKITTLTEPIRALALAGDGQGGVELGDGLEIAVFTHLLVAGVNLQNLLAGNQIGLIDEDAAIEAPQQIAPVGTPIVAVDYLRLRIGSLPYECFAVIFLDSQQRLISCDEMFRGTISASSVYPRDIVERTLKHHAASVVLSHNHPSGDVQPSSHDKALTQHLRAALALIDVRIIDHIIVSPNSALSMLDTHQF